MKKVILLSLFFSFALALSAQDITVPVANRPLITKRTASWCPLCGSWGWTLFRGLLDDNSDNALLIASHYSGEYQNPVAIAFSNNFGGFGQPTFFVNNENQNATSGTAAAVRATVKTGVQNINAQAPEAQSGILAEVDDNYTLTARAKTRFFEATEGEYYLGLYLIERNFFAYQAGQGNNAHHKQVLRLSFNGEPYGELIANGNIAAGTEADISHTIGIADMGEAGITETEGLYSDNFEVAAIIWKKVGNSYQVVNTNSADVEILSAVKDLRQLQAFEAWPAPAGQVINARVELSDPLPNAQLALFGADGSLVRMLFEGNLQEGPHNFVVERGGLSAGLYYLRLSSADRMAGRTVIFK